MSIAKKPKSKIPPTPEQQAEQFISGATAPVTASTKKEKGPHKTPIMIRFDPDILAQVDECAKKRGISRSAWIQFVVSRAIEQGEG